MPTIVHSYGVHYKYARRVPDAVFEQLRAAHDLRECLVDIHRDYETGKKDVWAAVPEIAVLLDEELLAYKEKTAAEDGIKALRMVQGTKRITGPDAVDAKARLTAARAEVRRVKNALKSAYDTAYALPGIKDAISANFAAKVEAEKATYADFVVGRRLHPATHHHVLDHHRTAVKNIAKKRASGVWAELRHHSFDGTGTLVIGLKDRGGLNTRRIDEVADPSGPHKNMLCLPGVPSEEEWEAMTPSERRRAGRIVARMKIRPARGAAENATAMTEIPIQVHRPVPPDAEIKSAMLVVKRIGTRRVATLNLALTIPEPAAVAEDSHCLVHFGWRKDSDDLVRAMTWSADAPLEQWRDIVDNPRYPALNAGLQVAPDLRSGRVCLPTAWMEKIRSSDDLRSERDEQINAVREELLAWIGDVGPVPHPSYVDPETGEPEMITAARLKRWKRPQRFIRLALDWREDPSQEPGGERIAATLEAWRVSDKKVTDSQVGASTRASRRRDDLYAQVADLFASSFGRITLDEVDHAELAVLPNQDEGTPNDLARTLGKQRAKTAAATLRGKLIARAGREGVPVDTVETAGVSIVHNACGTSNIRLHRQMSIRCDGCGERYDVDENAVEVISARAS